MGNQIENTSYLQQIDEMEEKLNSKLLQRKQWYLDQVDKLKNDNNDNEELEKIDSLLNDEFESKDDHSSILYEINRYKEDIGQHLTINTQKNEDNEDNDGEVIDDGNLCSIHFPPKKN